MVLHFALFVLRFPWKNFPKILKELFTIFQKNDIRAFQLLRCFFENFYKARH